MAAEVSTHDHPDLRNLNRRAAASGFPIPLQSLRHWPLILLAAGLLWRIIRYRLNFPFWGDEAMLASDLLDHGIFDINRPLANQQIAPPLFLILTQALRVTLSSAEWVLRLLPLLAGLSALALFLRFTRKHLAALDPLAALIALAFMALSFSPVQHSAEFKPYAFDLLCAVAFLFAGWRILQNPANRSHYLLLALLPPLAFGLSYPSVLIFGATSLALLPTVIRQAPRPCQALYALANLLALAALLLLLHFAASAQIAGSGRYMHAFWSNAFPPHDPWTFLPWLYRVHIGAIFAYPIKSSEFFAACSLLLALLGIARLIARKQFPFLTLLLAPFVITFAAACLGRYPYGGDVRLQQHLAPSIFTLIGLGLSTLFQRLAQRLPARPGALAPHLFLAALLTFPILGIIHDVRFPYLHLPIDQTARAQARALRTQLPLAAPLYIPQEIRQVPPVLAWYLRLYLPDVRLAPPPETSPTPYALLDCPATSQGPPPPPGWTRTTLLENAYRYRFDHRFCRIYLYQPAPPSPATR